MLTTETALRKDRTTGLAPLQHRHFSTIAAIIATMEPNRIKTAQHFADNLIKTNPHFDRERFLSACKP